MTGLRTVMVRSLVTWFRAFDDVVFPRRCLMTGRYLGTRTTRMPGIDDTALDTHRIAPPSYELFPRIATHFHPDDLALSDVHALYPVGTGTTIQHAIHAVKYDGRTKLAVAFGEELGTMLTTVAGIHVDAVLPVPIHPARRRERGYNQADFIARGVARTMEIPMIDDALVRTHYTGSQTRLDAGQRLKNVRNAIVVRRPDRVRNLRLLVVDDVLTTGATANGAAMALLMAGARRVEAAAIGVAI
ncbi:MAG: ComF family protein ['Candidatus Kapabacteria' thiocyanatum]|uniref:Phosphoribosyltransferase domain-containing protein n=1 Tax=Candidatus Kapaibacterium thiocyanatum TaxID=1895771 RepID=A0A1M3L6D8_9BACT|nr:ComF family protein ['Candidatus Kapabacteria' thiocyanatum]OJX61084.1 MAG: hypothetical protein BGO89_00340 ['Candidatus Kapabacteria' thiocyanatum]